MVARLPAPALQGLCLLGMLWTLPNSLIGLLAGVAALPCGARAGWSRRNRCLVFRDYPWGPGGAITFGNVILHSGASLDRACLTYEHRAGWRECPPVRLEDHERAHVYQYMLLGPLFLPLYLLAGGISVHNPLERAADRYASSGRGWWPWAPRRAEG